MRHFSKFAAALCLSAALFSCTGGEKADANSENKAELNSSFDAAAMDKVLAANIRSDDKARDIFRNPKETLETFDVSPEHSIIEYAPGGGWYTRILAPYVAEKGQYTAVSFPPQAAIAIGEDFVERISAGYKSFSNDQSESLGIEAEKLPLYTYDTIPESLNGTVDRVLIIRMMHNLKRWGIDTQEISALKATLKPDGMIGIVQHRAKDDAPEEYVDGNAGYLKRDDLIAFMDSQGFEVAAESDVNENPKDTADYPGGVWTLPPSLGSDDEDKSKFEAIGESNRMTILFKLKAS